MLKKANRLRLRGSFAYVRAHGVKYSDKLITFVALRGNCKRVGFVVSNKIGKAVRRNLVKRRMRGVVCEVFGDMGNGQMIFIARPGITELTYAELKERMIKLMRRAEAIKSV